MFLTDFLLTNDLPQLALEGYRNPNQLAPLFNEQDEAVKEMITAIIYSAHKAQKVGPCGQAPSDYPEFTRLPIQSNIDPISVNPDSFINVKCHVAVAEKESH